MLYKSSEWESASGWNCNCVDDLAGWAGLWYTPARILNISPAAFVELLITQYNAKIYYNEKTCFVSYYWEKQDDMRKFKNFINRKAREVNFQIN